jgi:hypothetical protein
LHRSLFQHAFSTEIVYVLILFPDPLLKLVSLFLRSIKLSQDTLGIPNPNPQHRVANVYSSIRFASGAQSNRTVTTNTASVMTQAGHVQLGISHDASIPGLVHESVEAKIGYETA